MSSYNNGFPFNINSLSSDEKKAAIKDFSEGSKELEECLLAMNDKGISTRACCKGYHEIDNIPVFMLDYYNKKIDSLALAKCLNAPYITCEQDSDIFSYLSIDLINNPGVVLENEFGNTIRFYGDNCYELIKLLTLDIKSGIKNNEAAVSKKLNESPTPEFYYRSYVYGLIRNGFTSEQIKDLNIILVLNACIRSKITTQDNFYDLCLKTGLDGDSITRIEQKLQEHGLEIESVAKAARQK